MSERCSGDIDPFSEFSVLAAECEALVSLDGPSRGWAGSMISPSACELLVVLVFFPLFGLTIGDCRTPRVLRGLGGTFLFGFLARIVELPGAECESKIISIGEFVVPEWCVL